MNRWTRLALIAAAALLLMGCALEDLYLQFYIDGKQTELQTPAGSDDTAVPFTVEQGQSVTAIAGNLKAHGLIDDTELFRRYVQYKGLDAGLQAGSYNLNKTMTIPEIARTLQSGRTAEQLVTIPEGRRLEEVADLVAEQTTLASSDFLAMAQNGWRGTDLPGTYTFLATIPLTGTLEGFLFPDTYRLPVDATAYDVVDRMLANFDGQVTPELRQAFEAQGMTLYEGITLASIVEREAVVAEERPLIAGVYVNRLRDGWFLSADPTVQYALGYQPDENSWWKHGLSFDDLDVVSPYNTYRNLGLPPGPIASAGLAVIEASARPAQTDYYFFMVDCDAANGSHVFAQTEDEHLANYARCGGVVPTP